MECIRLALAELAPKDAASSEEAWQQIGKLKINVEELKSELSRMSMASAAAAASDGARDEYILNIGSGCTHVALPGALRARCGWTFGNPGIVRSFSVPVSARRHCERCLPGGPGHGESSASRGG
eukprot:6484529-Amphidinium_carterae.1